MGNPRAAFYQPGHIDMRCASVLVLYFCNSRISCVRFYDLFIKGLFDVYYIGRVVHNKLSQMRGVGKFHFLEAKTHKRI